MASPATSTMNIEDYIDAQLNIYEIEVPGVARVYLAANKASLEEATHTENALNAAIANPAETDPKQMVPLLFEHPSYGGTRLEPLGGRIGDDARRAAIESARKLGMGESHVKHTYINKAIAAAQESGNVAELFDENGQLRMNLPSFLPGQDPIAAGFKLDQRYFDLAFRGGRCVILPWDEQQEAILARSSEKDDPKVHEEFDTIFKEVGAFLNGKREARIVDRDGNTLEENATISPGTLFLTPDFGPNRHLADWLHEHSPYVLGVNRQAGGGDGKAAYTVSGVLGGVDAAAEHGLWDRDNLETPITLIGSAGAMGSDLINRLSFNIYNPNGTYKNVRVCDTVYDDKAAEQDVLDALEKVVIDGRTFKKIPLKSQRSMLDLEDMSGLNITTSKMKNLEYQLIPVEWKVIKAEEGCFTDEALSNGNPPEGTKGLVITTSTGKEWKKSSFTSVPKGTSLLLAQNWGLPIGDEGAKIARELKAQGVTVIQGQALTPGGAGNSKLEIFWRAMHGFTKAMEGNIQELFPKRLGHEIVRMLCKNGVASILQLAKEKDITTVEAMAEFSDLSAIASSNVTPSTTVVGAGGRPAKDMEKNRHVA